jgi:hypothetical protein
VVAVRLVAAGIFAKAGAEVVGGVVVSGKVTSGWGSKVGLSVGACVIELAADKEKVLLVTGTDFSSGVITIVGSAVITGWGATGVVGTEDTVAAGNVVVAGRLVNAGAVFACTTGAKVLAAVVSGFLVRLG